MLPFFVGMPCRPTFSPGLTSATGAQRRLRVLLLLDVRDWLPSGIVMPVGARCAAGPFSARSPLLQPERRLGQPAVGSFRGCPRATGPGTGTTGDLTGRPSSEPARVGTEDHESNFATDPGGIGASVPPPVPGCNGGCGVERSIRWAGRLAHQRGFTPPAPSPSFRLPTFSLLSDKRWV
jgi:hypothetical protein